MDFVQGLDPSKLVFGGTALSFALSLFTSPPYNLAIFLFGTYAQEHTEAVQSLQTFTGLLGASAVFDVIWMIRNEQNGFIKVLTIPTFLAFAGSLRQRGAQFGGLGLGGADLAGPTVWSMPGGFTSSGRDGYQNVDEESVHASVRPPAAHSSPPQQGPPPAPGAYQTV
ncbi:hypothetical protein BDQ12DRAFT_427035 [Crucibulum laeve]|uniref:Uncharacterized protein n=1 Tax=Crucibulum laeve TaxID=68775 RepID=A0A5C3M6W8_9AGAR|nr:hypothetical protein BDQ12DRAFT_427035 [Crucibulum laeve]